jgi:hypothetical protein
MCLAGGSPPPPRRLALQLSEERARAKPQVRVSQMEQGEVRPHRMHVRLSSETRRPVRPERRMRGRQVDTMASVPVLPVAEMLAVAVRIGFVQGRLRTPAS